MTLTGWLLLAVALIVTAGVAYWLGRLSVSRSGRMQALEQERDAATEELTRYQGEVRDHFETTAQLFNQVTGSYRQLYEHLADGAGRLAAPGDERLLQQSPEQRRLPEDLSADAAGSDVPDAVTEEPVSAGQPAEADTAAATEVAEQPAADERSPVGDATERDTDPAEAAEPKADKAQAGDVAEAQTESGQDREDSGSKAEPHTR